MSECFTIVFLGRISDFKGNPYKAETVFGKPYAIGVGDALEENEELRDLLCDCPQEMASE